jgi:hypothetical protein
VSFLTIFDSRVAGIPCQIGVLDYKRHAPLSAHQAHSDIEFYGFTETDYVLLDRRGNPAPWLQDKVSDDSDILAEIQEQMEAKQCKY